MISRRLVLFRLLAMLVLIGVSAWLLWPRTAITRENAARIREGMTLAEVESVLGGLPRDDATGPVSEDVDGPADEPGNCYEAELGGDGDELIGWERHWSSDTILINIRFDVDNRVTRIQICPLYPVERGPLDTVRRCLGL